MEERNRTDNRTTVVAKDKEHLKSLIKEAIEKNGEECDLNFIDVSHVTDMSGLFERQTVFDLLPPSMPRVMSVGRLDLNSEGLLLLTNNGELARELELPRNAWSRRYRVRVHGKIDEEKMARLQEGVVIDGVAYGKVLIVLDQKVGTNAWLTMTLNEGKNREIRKLMKFIGLEVARLIRVSYGPFQLGNLKRGEVKEVPHKVLKEQLGSRFEI